ncbi:MAG TPA: DUF4439 domain-containing protein [Mycobacteriales bacterium]|nr:DUF4439 domain-containing protein [Mycobacteriales bacterium]
MTATSAADPAVRVLTALLEAEHAVLYGYGVLGARLADDALVVAQAAASAHRAQRDRLVGLLRDRGAEPPAPAAAYDAVAAGAADALALAVRLETGLGVLFRDLVGSTDDPRLRRIGVDGLVETAVRAASWRSRLGAVPATEAFPGTA